MRLLTYTPGGNLAFAHKSQVIYVNNVTEPVIFTSNIVQSANVVSFDINESYDIICVIYENKMLISYKLTTGCMISSAVLKKCPSSVVITAWNEVEVVFIVADKAGDVIIVNAKDMTAQYRVGGHTASIVSTICASFVVSVWGAWVCCNSVTVASILIQSYMHVHIYRLRTWNW